MEPKILFLDLDGTLLNDRKELTAGNRQAMETALARGHRMVIASGRPLKSVLIQAARLGLDGPGCYAIACNGAILYDFARKTEIYKKTLRFEDLYALFDEANRRGVYIQTYEREDVVIEPRNDPAIAERYCAGVLMDWRIIGDVRDLSEAPVKALLVDFDGRDKTEPMRQWVLSRMGDRLDSYFSGPFYLEVVSAGISKGRAITRLCDLLGIPVSQSVAAGDEANDVTMLRAAGVGVAMRNGVPAAKDAADYITLRDNNHDGVAELIDRFLLSS